MYGFGDVIVLAVSSFLLMPLYTRTLSQSDYGIYIITKTNIDIFTYLFHFGLISAVGRLYFEYKKKDEHHEYISSVILFFMIIASVLTLLLYFYGEMFWNVLSPKVSAYPYIWFCLAIVVFSFYSSFTSIWLRVEEKASLFVILQIASALVLLVLVLYNLVAVHNGLTGLLSALVINAICAAAILPILLRNKFVFKIKIEHITTSLRYAVPIVVGYCAYFVLNRFGTIILQRHVPVDQVAIFGLGQQMAMIVTIASNAFAKSLQPVIFSAENANLVGIIDRSGKLYLLLMSCIVNLAILFASDILSVAAPSKYSGGYYVFIIMLLANFIYSAGFISDSILLYFRFPMTSTMVSIFGGVLSLIMCLLMVPGYKLYGAAFSTLFAFTGVLAVGFYVTRKLLRHSGLKYILRIIPVTVLITIFAVLLKVYGPSQMLSLGIKLILSVLIIYATYAVYLKNSRDTNMM
jgi:O-antigen/teichoic acid export membrane protein